MPPPNSRLALAIPTYNRAEVLGENLKAMLPELIKYNIPVFISDDSTNADTEYLVSVLAAEYPLIFYRHNEPRLGHDANFFSSIEMSDADYVWFLGDSIFVKSGGFQKVLNTLKSDPDFCFVNSYTKNTDDSHVGPKGVKPFLINHAWYLTLTGATIYGRRPRALKVSAERRTCWQNFPQLGLILECCGFYDILGEWVGQKVIEVNQKKKSYWGSQAFKIFAQDWSVMIRSFPNLFDAQECNRIIRSHSSNTGIFGIFGLVYLRAENILNIGSYQEFEAEIAVATNHPNWAKFLCFVPTSICHYFVGFIRSTKGIRTWISEI